MTQLYVIDRSFHALDSEGNVYVWGVYSFGYQCFHIQIAHTYVLPGTLQGVFGAYAAENQGFSAPGKPARTPHKLNLPVPIRSIRWANVCTRIKHLTHAIFSP